MRRLSVKPIEFVAFLGMGAAALSLANSNHSDRWAVRESETIAKTFTLAAPPMRLIVDNVDGYVHITGISGSEVRVTAHKTIRAETDADLQEAKADVKLNMDEKPGGVSVYYDAPWRCNGESTGCRGESRHFYNVTYNIDVAVPVSARIVVSTVNDGDVTVEKTTGDFEVRNVNGGIHMQSVAGSGDVSSVNGPIVIQFSRNPAGPCSFKSINGQLDVYFPTDLSADLLFKTFNGQIYSDFDVTARPLPVTEPEQKNGKFIYRSNGLRAGRAGAGGPEFTFDAFNGNIRLHRGQ
jgi:hypothetical protein